MSPRPARLARSAQLLGLPVLAVALVVAVLAVQLTHGGGRFEPLRPADACAPRTVTTRATGIEGLTERLVLLGVNDAACRLGTSREALTLALARGRTPTDAQVDAVRRGLLDAVGQLDADGELPPASDLVDEALDATDLNGLLKAAIRALPDSVVDAALKTDDVLTRTIDDLDVRALLADIDDTDDLEAQVEAAVTSAVKESLEQRLRDLV